MLRTHLRPSLILLALLVVPLAAPATGTAAFTTPIHPGDRVTHGTAGCTLSFAWDGVGPLDGRVFFTTAAHCVDGVGQASKVAGHTIGEVVLVGDACCSADDYAFIEVAPAYHANVGAAVRGHPDMPSDVAEWDDTFTGDPLLFSGHGTGFGVTAATRENRAGVLVWDTGESYSLYGPVVWGDSGGPILHATTGAAFGLVSRISGVADTGPTVAGVRAKAWDAGWPVELRTVE